MSKTGPKPKNKGGRTSMLRSAKFLRDVERLAARGLNQRQIAEVLNIGESTISIWKSKKTELEQKFTKAIKRGQAEGVRRRLARIEKAGINGSWQADAWLLERGHPEQFGRNDRVRVSDADGNPVSNTTVIAPTVVFVQPQKEELTADVVDVPQVANGNGEANGDH